MGGIFSRGHSDLMTSQGLHVSRQCLHVILQTVEIVVADRAPINEEGNIVWREAVTTLVVPIRVILRESLCINFPPTKYYCFLMLFDSLVSFNYPFEREKIDTKIIFKLNDG